jgi:hypothetical protein
MLRLNCETGCDYDVSCRPAWTVSQSASGLLAQASDWESLACLWHGQWQFYVTSCILKAQSKISTFKVRTSPEVRIYTEQLYITIFQGFQFLVISFSKFQGFKDRERSWTQIAEVNGQ